MGRRGLHEGRGWARARFVLTLSAAILLAGCQLVGVARESTEPPPPREAPPEPAPEPEIAVPLPEGEFRGELLVEGDRMPAHLALRRQTGSTFHGILEGPVEFRAEGPGTATGPELRLELSYGGDCPGTMTLEGSWDPDAGVLSGIVRASDCTGRGQGTFRFQRS